jgi:hypothetical protein
MKWKHETCYGDAFYVRLLVHAHFSYFKLINGFQRNLIFGDMHQKLSDEFDFGSYGSSTQGHRPAGSYENVYETLSSVKSGGFLTI